MSAFDLRDALRGKLEARKEAEINLLAFRADDDLGAIRYRQGVIKGTQDALDELASIFRDQHG